MNHKHQTVLGLTLLVCMFGTWLAVHLFGVFGLVITPATLPLALALMLLQCWLFVGLFIVAHDAMHGTLAPGRPRLNNAVGAFLLFVYAAFDWRTMKALHMAHHAHPGSAEDPDFNADDPHRFWPWYGCFLKRYFRLRSMLYVSLVVTVYFFLGAHPLNILLLYGAPAIASSLQLFYFGTYRPHRLDGLGFVDQHNARSDRFGVPLSLLTCFFFGYHHTHHLHPGVPWWRLPKVHRNAS